jgi:hypothetical protein
VKLAEREGPSTLARASLENPSKTGPSARVKILLCVLRRLLSVNARPPSRLRRGNRRPDGGAGGDLRAFDVEGGLRRGLRALERGARGGERDLLRLHP